MPYPPQPVVVFDLDGTLVDSAPDLVDALNVILARDGIAPLPLERARKLVGRGGRILIRLGYEAQNAAISDARIEELFPAYLAEYEKHLADRTLPYPGVLDALDRLSTGGHILAVCTNKYEKPAKMLLGALKMTDRFAAIVGADTFSVSKPNGAVLHRTIERAGGDPKRAIMVGDTVTDVSAARNAGLPIVCVDFGYAPESMTELQPDRVISHFDELGGAIADLGAALPQTA